MKNQGIKLGNGKGSKPINVLYNLKELKNKNTKFKRNTTAPKKTVTQENDDDEGDDNDKPEDAGDQFRGNKYKNKTMENLLLGLHYYVPWSFISYNMKLIVIWLNILDFSSGKAIKSSVQ